MYRYAGQVLSAHLCCRHDLDYLTLCKCKISGSACTVMTIEYQSEVREAIILDTRADTMSTATSRGDSNGLILTEVT